MKRPALIILSILLILIGLVNCFWFLFYDISTDNPWIMTTMSLLSPYHFSYLFEDYHLKLGAASYSFNLLNLYLYLSFLTGLLTYTLSNGRELRLIRFNYSLIILSFFISIPFIIIRFFLPNEDSTALTTEAPNPMIYLLYLPRILLLFVTYRVLGSLKKEAPPELSVEHDTEGRQVTYLLPAAKGQRFINYLVDNILIVIYIITILKASVNVPAYYTFFKHLEQTLGKELSLVLIFTIARFFYYFIFETLFAATPGKILSQTRVSDISGKHAGIAAILKRTLCRFIPFEAFTFFTGSNLHDEQSDTYVIREQQKGVSSDIYLWIMLSLFILIIIFTTLSDYLN